MARKDERFTKAEPSRTEAANPSAAIFPSYSGHKLRQLAAAHMGEAGALQLQVARLMRTEEEDPLLSPTPHVVFIDDVTRGLGLEYADEQRIQSLVNDSVPSFSQKTQTQRIMFARGRLVSTLRDALKHIDSNHRDEIVRRAMVYWRKNYQTAYDKEPTVRWRGSDEVRKAMASSPLPVIPIDTLLMKAVSHKYLSRRPDGKGGYIYNYGEAHEHKEGHEKIEIPKKKETFHVSQQGESGAVMIPREGHHHGDFAVHKEKGAKDYSITHKPTGLKAGSSFHLGEAHARAHHMNTHASGVSKEDVAAGKDSAGYKKLKAASQSFKHEIEHKDADEKTHAGAEEREAADRKKSWAESVQSSKKHDERMGHNPNTYSATHHKAAERFKEHYGHWPEGYDEGTNPRVKNNRTRDYLDLAKERQKAAREHRDRVLRGRGKSAWKDTLEGDEHLEASHKPLEEAEKLHRNGLHDKASAEAKKAHEHLDRYEEAHGGNILPKNLDDTPGGAARKLRDKADEALRSAGQKHRGVTEAAAHGGRHVASSDVPGAEHLSAAQRSMTEGHQAMDRGDHSKANFHYGHALNHVAEYHAAHTKKSLLFIQDLSKGATRGGKYYRRVPTGDPKRPWRYYYTESSYKQAHGDQAHANGPEESESSAHARAKSLVGGGTNVTSRMKPLHVHLAARGAMKAKDYKTANAMSSHILHALSHGHPHSSTLNGDTLLRSAWHKLNPGSDKAELNSAIDRERGVNQDPKKYEPHDSSKSTKLSTTERQQMARERRQELDDDRHGSIKDSERRDLEAQIKLLSDSSADVHWDHERGRPIRKGLVSDKYASLVKSNVKLVVRKS